MTTAPSIHPTPDARSAVRGPGRRTIDAPTRVFHWLLAACFIGAYLTGDSEHWRLVHITLGYTMAGLLGFRIVYGFVGPQPVRWSALWRRLGGLPAWLRKLVSASTWASAPHWRQAQPLAMALAIAAVLVLIAPVVLSGYATYSDWGGEWLEELHEVFANLLLTVVLAHIVLIASLSLLRRRNLAQPMLTGHVDGAGPDLVPHNRTWLATLMLAAVLAFWGWQALQAPGEIGDAPSAAAHQANDDDDD